MQAMILAAGFGTRLKPYSLYKPKPLFPVLNTPLLLATVKRLENSGFSKIVVNCHHLREQIVDTLRPIPEVIIQEERQILGTGGGLRQALDKIDDEPLLVTNGDIYHLLDFAELYRHHLQSGNELTMALHDYPRFNKIIVEDGRIVHFDGDPSVPETLAYTGIQVINPDLLSPIKKETASCIIEYYRTLLAQSRVIHMRRFDDSFWTDMGTPGDYLDLHRALLTGEIPRWPELDCDADSICMDPQAQCSDDIELMEWACIGRARIGSGVQLSRCVVWDGTEIVQDTVLSDEIVGPQSLKD